MGNGRGRATIELVFSAFDGALRPLPVCVSILKLNLLENIEVKQLAS